MNAERAGGFESFRTLRAAKLSATVLARCREESGAAEKPAKAKPVAEAAAR